VFESTVTHASTDLLDMPENVHFEDAAPTTNQPKAPTSHPAAAPTLLSTNHKASDLSELYSTGAAVEAEPPEVAHVSVETTKFVAHTKDTEESQSENEMRDA
jgi:hypothetical protein